MTLKNAIFFVFISSFSFILIRIILNKLRIYIIMKEIKRLKKEIRIIGIDDGHFEKFKSKKCLVVGVIFRGAEFIDGLISFHVMVDGDDATAKIIESVNKSKHKGQISVIMINGIALGGFNVIDIEKTSKETGLPVIVISRRKPRLNTIKNVLINLGKKEKIKLIEKAGIPKKFTFGKNRLYFQFYGIDEEKTRQLIKMTLKHGNVPEPIREAHIIATGITLGENRGRA